jgi:hypothetical protein
VLEALREIPPGAVRDELMALLVDLLAYVRDPRCARAQGDGVPCTTLSVACEECQQVSRVLANVRARMSVLPPAAWMPPVPASAITSPIEGMPRD